MFLNKTPLSPLTGVRLVHSFKARRLALRVDVARGEICLIVPKRMSEKRAWEFAHANVGWIQTRLSKLEKHTAIPFTHGTVIPIFGIPRTIQINHASGRVTTCVLHDEYLHVHTKRTDPATNIKRYLYDLLDETARPLAHEKATSIGKTITAFDLRDTKSRWGSCAPDGRIMLCWRLIFAPIHVIDYVVAHEVAHLKHMNHSERFWGLCDNLSDDMAGAKDWLKANGETLLRYGVQP